MTDSLVRELRSVEAAPTPDDQSRIRLLRMGLANVLGEIRTNYDTAMKDALAPLEADQQPKATEMLDKQKQDAEKFINERLRGGQRRGGDQR